MKKPILKTSLWVLGLALVIGFGLVLGNGSLKANIISAIDVAGINLSGKSYDEAAYDLNDEYLALLEGEVVIEFEGDFFETDLRKLGVEFDTFKTLELAYEASKQQGAFDTLKANVLGSEENVEVDTVFEIDRGKMEAEIMRLVPLADVASDAELVIGEDGNVEVLAESPGYIVDFDDIHDQLFASLLELDLPRLKVKKKFIEPKYTASQAQEDAEILKSILSREITFNPYGMDGFDYEKKVRVQPDWVKVKDGKVDFDKERVTDFILAEIAPEVEVAAIDAVISAMPSDGAYAEVSAVAREGRKLDVATAVHRAIVASKGGYGGNNPVNMEFLSESAKVINETGVDLGEMVLLGQGKSNFEGSPDGRDFNIRKGLDEKYNNVFLAPGDSFSYNGLLGPVTHAAGWQDSLAIFGGKNLRPVPGGGLCQVSTTIYRALVNSGLDITEKSNHSLYVHYYKAYGDGLDSAIYPGSKDLRFVNDTGNYVLIQAYAEGDDAYVNVYGTPDGRSIKLDGPFYSGQVPEEFQGKVSPKWNQIMWIQTITRPNGEVEEKVLTSTYRTAPR